MNNEPFTGSAAAWVAVITAFAGIVLSVGVLTHSAVAVSITIFLILFTAVTLAIIENGQKVRK
jgi:hypothetical protein